MSKRQRHAAPAPRPPTPAPAPQQPRRPGGGQFQPPTSEGSQLGGGPGLIPGFEQPGGSNMFAMDLINQGNGSDVA